MSQDAALEKQSEGLETDLFASVEEVLGSTVPETFIDTDVLMARFAALKESFVQDYRRIAETYDLLFGEEIIAYGERTTSVFSRWEDQGGGPSLPAMIVHALQYFGLDHRSAMAKSAFIAAILAEYPNELQYHGNEHYRKVLFHGIRLMVTHNQIYKGTDRVFDGDEVGLMLVASCIHDLGHEGGDNLRDGVYTPGYMEQRAFDIARPYLEAVDLERDLIGAIETLVFCTDITFFAGENSPCIRMKRIYRNVVMGDESEDVSLMMMGKLRRYEDNPHLIEMAMMLHEADVGSSAGLSYEQTIKETIDIMEERDVKTAGPKTVLAFLREQLGETMFTEAAKRIFGPALVVVIEQAEKDILAGRETFY